MDEEEQQKQIGKRAEEVSAWYFRLNGFLSIPGFIVHPDRLGNYPRTEADLIAVRFPFSREIIEERSMTDDAKVVQPTSPPHKTLFVLVEVAAGICKINPTWSNPAEKNIHRIVRRLGFVRREEINNIANKMYQEGRWESNEYVMQHICVGSHHDPKLQSDYSHLVQMEWNDIAIFLRTRFRDFPQKIPAEGPLHPQWPEFGRKYAEWFASTSLIQTQDSERAVQHYILSGCCM